jgi:hypothetical protein
MPPGASSENTSGRSCCDEPDDPLGSSRATVRALGLLRESQTAFASRGVIDLIAFIANIPYATRCDSLSSLGP